MDISNLVKIVDTSSSRAEYIKSKILDLAFSGALLPKEIPSPDTWKTLRLDEVCDYIQRGKSPSYDEKGEVRVVSQKCVQWDGFHPENSRFINDSTIEKYTRERFLRDSDILWNSTGSGTVGRTCIFSGHSDERRYVADSHVTVLRSSKVYAKFLLYWTRSPKVQARVLGLTTGSTNQQELNLSTIKSLEISFPSHEYQVLLADYIDGLITLCEELSTRIELSQEALLKARKSAINAISTAQTVGELRLTWERIQRNWVDIAGTPDSIDSIKTLILELAVRGDLVTVNQPNVIKSIEWTTSELKLDDSKLWHLPTLREEKKEGWNRIPLAKIGSWGSGGTPTSSRKDFYQDGTVPWAVIGDLNNEILTSTETSISEKALAESSAKMVPKGSILIAMYGASIGKTALTGIECCTNQAIAHCIVDGKIVSKDYFFLVAKSLKRHLIQEGKGAAQPNISQSVLKHLIIDVPPLSEQALIVNRVEALMQLCDRLSYSLRESEELAEKFARSVVSA